VANTWRPTAACIYRNWLLHMRAQKARRLRARKRTNLTGVLVPAEVK
jgi:hypothetical protein